MKKSKVLIPAMALLLFSTAASITGTVAWFQASKEARFTVGNFAVVKTSENLVYDLTAGNNTTVSGSPGAESISFGAADSLTHASYDHVNHKIWKAAQDGSTIDSMITLSDNGTDQPSASDLKVADSGSGVTYCAATWKVDFKLAYTSVSRTIGLFVDFANTKFSEAITFVEDTASSGKHVLTTEEQALTLYTDVACTVPATIDSETHEIAAATAGTTYYKALPDATGYGFRIAFFPVGANKTYGANRVIARNVASDVATYVSGADLTAAKADMDGTAYVSPAIIGSNNSDSMPIDGVGTLSAAQNLSIYLGNFPYTADTEVTLSYLCVAWYEGTDSHIVNQNALSGYETMAAQLAFKTVSLSSGSGE